MLHTFSFGRCFSHFIMSVDNLRSRSTRRVSRRKNSVCVGNWEPLHRHYLSSTIMGSFGASSLCLVFALFCVVSCHDAIVKCSHEESLYTYKHKHLLLSPSHLQFSPTHSTVFIITLIRWLMGDSFV